jgi:hypothetical protein
MLSFAPYLYKDVFSARGGPIDKVDAGKVQMTHHPEYLANAYLRSDLASKSKHTIYGNTDGSGSSDNPAVAQHMAISEALERWAFRQTLNSEKARKFFFHIDPSSNGMAAFPGFKWQARRRARFEALERWAIIGWWDGSLKGRVSEAPYPGVGMVRIEHEQDGEVVILFHKSEGGHVAYGHAGGSTLVSAAARAAIELARSEFVLTQYRARGGLAKITNFYEQRCLHFSTPEGHSEFLRKAYSAPSKPAPPWRLLYDGEVPGPWAKYAAVWRHVVQMPSYAFLDARETVFLW